MKIEQAVRSVLAGLAAGLALHQTEAPLSGEEGQKASTGEELHKASGCVHMPCSIGDFLRAR